MSLFSSNVRKDAERIVAQTWQRPLILQSLVAFFVLLCGHYGELVHMSENSLRLGVGHRCMTTMVHMIMFLLFRAKTGASAASGCFWDGAAVTPHSIRNRKCRPSFSKKHGVVPVAGYSCGNIVQRKQ